MILMFNLGLGFCANKYVKTVLPTEERDCDESGGGRGLPSKMANRDKEEAEVCLCAC